MIRDLFTITIGMIVGYVLKKLGIKTMSLSGFVICVVIAVIYVFIMSFVK